MEEQKEIRCINKNGKVRWISEHLTKDPQYMKQMDLTVQHLDEKGQPEKPHFTAFKETKEIKTEEDEFSELLKEEETENKKKK